MELLKTWGLPTASVVTEYPPLRGSPVPSTGLGRQIRSLWLVSGPPRDTHPPFQVSVTARDDVPFFGPPLPDPAVFRKVRGSPQPHHGPSRTERVGALGVHSVLYLGLGAPVCQGSQAPLTDGLGPSFSVHLGKNCDCLTKSQSRLYHCFPFCNADSVAFPPVLSF